MTMTAACHRRDISDRAWAILEPILPGGPGKVGRPAQKTAASTTPYFGFSATAPPGATCLRTTDIGLLPTIASTTGRKTAHGSDPWTPWPTPDLEWLMTDGNYVKVHQHGTGSVGRTKGG